MVFPFNATQAAVKILSGRFVLHKFSNRRKLMASPREKSSRAEIKPKIRRMTLTLQIKNKQIYFDCQVLPDVN